jgi:hypothetical protein
MQPQNSMGQPIARETRRICKVRVPKPHRVPAADSETSARQVSSPSWTQAYQSSAKFLYAAYTSCVTCVLLLFKRRDENTRAIVPLPRLARVQKDKLQTLMDRRTAEAQRAHDNRNVIVTFLGGRHFNRNAEKRKRSVPETAYCIS